MKFVEKQIITNNKISFNSNSNDECNKFILYLLPVFMIIYTKLGFNCCFFLSMVCLWIAMDHFINTHYSVALANKATLRMCPN